MSHFQDAVFLSFLHFAFIKTSNKKEKVVVPKCHSVGHRGQTLSYANSDACFNVRRGEAPTNAEAMQMQNV